MEKARMPGPGEGSTGGPPRSRTGMGLPPRDFESRASTSSASRPRRVDPAVDRKGAWHSGARLGTGIASGLVAQNPRPARVRQPDSRPEDARCGRPPRRARLLSLAGPSKARIKGRAHDQLPHRTRRRPGRLLRLAIRLLLYASILPGLIVFAVV